MSQYNGAGGARPGRKGCGYRAEHAAATGPIATMPGTLYGVPPGAKCDTYDCVNPATVRVQGETDSFGAEMHDLCGECARREHQGSRDFFANGECEWCQKQATDRREQRDYDEGTCGRVYFVCGKCRGRYQERLAEEAQYDDWSSDEGALDDA